MQIAPRPWVGLREHDQWWLVSLVVGSLGIALLATLTTIRRWKARSLAAVPIILAGVLIILKLLDRWPDVPLMEPVLLLIAGGGVIGMASRTIASLRMSAVTAALAVSFALLLLIDSVDALVDTGHPHVLAVAPAIAIVTILVGFGTLLSIMPATFEAAGTDTAEWQTLRNTLPVLMIAPALVVTAQLVITVGMRLETTTLLLTLVNTAILGVILLWLVGRLAQERETLDSMSRAVDAAPVAVVDDQGRIVHWSLGCRELYGWTAADAVGRVKYELLRSVASDGRLPNEIAPEEWEAGVELIETRKDGTLIHVQEQRRSVTDRERPAHSVLSVSDIGPRIAMERALRESETRLMLAAQAHHIGIFEWDVPTGKLMWLADTEELLGLPPGTMNSYDDWAALVIEEDLPPVLQRIEAAVWSKAERFTFFYRMRLPDGEIRAIDGSARCFYDESGEIVRTVGVNIDVTERVEREAQLAAREAQLRSVLETVPDAMIVIDEKGYILTFSRAAEQLFGYAASAVMGRNVAMLMPREHSDEHDNYLSRYRDTGERRVIGKTRLLTALHSDGHVIPIELRVGEARFNGMRVFTGFVRDISERLANEQRLETLRTELTHVGRINAMGELAAGIAHEINQPLSAIANFMATAETILAHGADPVRIKRQLVAAREQSLRAGQIIRRLREFVSRHETESRVESLEATIRDAIALVLVGQDRMAVTIDYDFDAEAQFMFADRIQVQQVVVNLVRNSVQALHTMPAEYRHITVSTSRLDQEWLEVTVADSGPGLAEAMLSQLYMPFMSTKGETGMGIGLSICRRIVEAHGGIINAENRPEGGAEFRFTLPRVEEEKVSP